MGRIAATLALLSFLLGWEPAWVGAELLENVPEKEPQLLEQEGIALTWNWENLGRGELQIEGSLWNLHPTKWGLIYIKKVDLIFKDFNGIVVKLHSVPIGAALREGGSLAFSTRVAGLPTPASKSLEWHIDWEER